MAVVAAIVLGTYGVSVVGASSAKPVATIHIMGTSTFTGVNSPYPETEAAMYAAVSQINATGGIRGHKLAITFCDDQGNPNIAQSCAQSAVANKDVAVISPMDNQTTSEIPILQKAHIAFVGDITQTALDATSPVSFPISAGGYNLNGAVGLIAKKLNCTNVGAVIIQAPNITTTIEASIKSSLAAVGITYSGAIYAPTSDTNFTSAVAAIEQQGADCVTTAIDEPQTTAFLAAMQQSGSTMKIIQPAATLASLDSLAGVANGAYVYSGSRLPTDPNINAAINSLKKFAPGTAINAPSLEAWSAVRIVAAAMKKVRGVYTAATVLSAMNHLTAVTTMNVYPPYTTSRPNKIKGQTRVFNPDIIIYQVEGTKFKAVSSFLPIPGV